MLSASQAPVMNGKAKFETSFFFRCGKGNGVEFYSMWGVNIANKRFACHN